MHESSGNPARNRRVRSGLSAIAYADGLVMGPLHRCVESFAGSPGVAGKRVLDFGCGDQPYRSLFEARGATYLAADIDGEPDLRIEPGAPLPVESRSIDAVVSFQVLEHVRDVPFYLGECRRVLRPGGKLFLSTHGTWPYHPHPTDFWRWTKEGLVVTVEAAGFATESVTPLCGPGAWLPMFPLLIGQRLFRRAAVLLAPINVPVNLLALTVDRLTPAGVRDNNAAIYVIQASVRE